MGVLPWMEMLIKVWIRKGLGRTSHARGDYNAAFGGANVRQGEFGQQHVRGEVDIDHAGDGARWHVAHRARGHDAVIAEQHVELTEPFNGFVDDLPGANN